MDIQKVASQLIAYLGQNPQLIQQFIEHPYSTTAKATGSDAEISKKDMSQIVTATAALANNQKLGGNDIANIASVLLGQNNNSVHSLTNMLFGGGTGQQATQYAQQQTTSSGTLDLGSLVSLAALAATLMSGASAANQQQQQVQQQVQRSLVKVGLDAVLTGMKEYGLYCHALIIKQNNGSFDGNCRLKEVHEKETILYVLLYYHYFILKDKTHQ